MLTTAFITRIILNVHVFLSFIRSIIKLKCELCLANGPSYILFEIQKSYSQINRTDILLNCYKNT